MTEKDREIIEKIKQMEIMNENCIGVDCLNEEDVCAIRKVTTIAMKYINEVDHLNKYIEKMYKAYIDVLEKYSEVLEQQIAEFKED